MRNRRRTAAVSSAAVLLFASLAALGATPAHAAGLPCGALDLDGGGDHSLAAGSNGSLYAWGSNFRGQLGDGTTTNRSSAVQVPGLSGVTAVAAGAEHSLAVGPGGVVHAWGYNSTGQLGDGTTTTRTGPVQVSGLTGVTDVATGGFHSLAIGPGGTVYAWGNNAAGQLGDGTTTARTTPVQVPGLTGVIGIAASGGHSLAVTTGGAVFAWGTNVRGQLGDGTTTTRTSPVQVPGLGGVTRIAAGAMHSVALGTGGVVYTWGGNDFGQLGIGNTFSRSTPQQLSGETGVTAIAAGSHHSLAITASGTVRAWGANASGQLGDGTTTDRDRPVTTATITGGMSAVAGGGSHSLAVGSSGLLYAWGENGSGQVGDGTVVTRSTPVQIANCPPSVTVVNDSPDPVPAGNPVTFSVGWTDPNVGDQVRAVVCKTNAVNAGSCPGGVWAIGSPSSASPATTSYTTAIADIGAQAYYAFACDATNQCSQGTAGSFTVVASGPAVTSASASPDPVVARNTVTFSVSWTDPNAGDQARAVVCKTNAVSAGTCPGGAWATGAPSSASPATAAYPTTSGDVGTHPFHAFACDTANQCSPAVSGTFTVSPDNPGVTFVTDSPDPAVVGDTVTFSVGWTDPNTGDQARAVICRTNAVNAGACPGGAWAAGALTATSPAGASFTAVTGDVGSNTYYAFVCDSVNQCSAAVTGTFTVVHPACSDGADNDGDNAVDFPADPGCAGPADRFEGPTCPPPAPGVVLCLDAGTQVAEHAVSEAADDPAAPEHRVAGYVDLYRFTVAGVTTTVPCVFLRADGEAVNPCATAGGTFVSRATTLVDVAEGEPVLKPLVTVRVCRAELTATVASVGVDSAPVFTVC